MGILSHLDAYSMEKALWIGMGTKTNLSLEGFFVGLISWLKLLATENSCVISCSACYC